MREKCCRFAAKPGFRGFGHLRGPRSSLLRVLSGLLAFCALTVVGAEMTHHVPLFPPASDWEEYDRRGVLRVISKSDADGVVRIDAFDDVGVHQGPVMLALGAGRTVQLTSSHLEDGSAAKGLTGAIGAGTGHWRLEVSSEDVDIEVLAYLDANSGFLTAMHDVAPRTGGIHWIVTVNPASNIASQSLLRLTNPTSATAEVGIISGVDDTGGLAGHVRLNLAPGASRTLTAQELEQGADGVTGTLGAGTGKWRLRVYSSVAIQAASVLSATASGLLANLSTAPRDGSAHVRHVPFFPAASDWPTRQGFVRMANGSADAVEVHIDVFDDDGVNHGPVTLAVGPYRTVHFNSSDIENGNVEKGLAGAAGAGAGAGWRLLFSCDDGKPCRGLDVQAYQRTVDGLLVAVHDVAPTTGTALRIPTFNPAGNVEREGLLRLVNPTTDAARVVVRGIDDSGAPGTGPVELTLSAGASRTLTAQDLESGASGLIGALGDGSGSWQLTVESSAGVLATSMVLSHGTGHLTNLATSPIPLPTRTKDPTPVDIPDGFLRRSIEAAIDKEREAVITRAELASLISLDIFGDVTDLTGLEYATGLDSLTLERSLVTDISPLAKLTTLKHLRLNWNSQIVDISPLAELAGLESLHLAGSQVTDISALRGLAGLEVLFLWYNRIADISALTGLTGLESLYLANNEIADISALAGLTGLERLLLSDNQIADISALAGLTGLRTLSLGGNRIADISALTNLAGLDWLYLSENRIADIAPLVANAGLGEGDQVYLAGNPLTDESCDDHEPALAARGVSAPGICPMDIPDAALQTAIASALGVGADATVLRGDLRALTVLDAQDAGIADLTGLEFATGLERLYLSANQIGDISVLAGLTVLVELGLRDNEIEDVTPLAGLTALRSLRLDDNIIVDISALSGLTGLVTLDLGNNWIEDLSPLAGLTGLVRLSLAMNRIADASALSGLTGLEWLDLSDNRIADIAPLVANAGLGEHDEVYLAGNPLADESCDDHEPALAARGVSAPGICPMDIPDAALQTAIASALGVGADATVLRGDLRALTVLDAQGAGIADLTGLAFATGLRTMDLSDNRIADVSALAGLTGLRWLALEGNQIADVSALSGLTDLRWLYLRHNQIADVSALSGLTDLRWLYLSHNQIADIAALSGLTGLGSLDLAANQIADVSALSGLTRLEQLYLGGNQVAGISALMGLTSLRWVDLAANRIADISALSGLISLGSIDLSDNRIADIAPLVANVGLEEHDVVYLADNPLADEACDAHEPALAARGVSTPGICPMDIPDAALRAAVASALGAGADGPVLRGDLRGLTAFDAPDAGIADLTGLGFATGLERLDLSGNGIVDVSALSGLTGLEWLDLSDNRIADIAPLVANGGLDEGDQVDLAGNPLSDQSCGQHIPALVDRGVTVHDDCGT